MRPLLAGLVVFAAAAASASARAHADALPAALHARCTEDHRLAPAAREALAHHSPLDTRALRAAGEREGAVAATGLLG